MRTALHLWQRSQAHCVARHRPRWRVAVRGRRSQRSRAQSLLAAENASARLV